jgi:hydroxymethylglutaryl-CoA lyase/(R)-citramalyl-CoA lyase
VRAGFVRRLATAGLPRIEAVSFVNPERVPQMAGAEEVVATVGEVDAELSGLVLNERGWERLAATPLRRVNVTLAATEEFNRRNGNATLAEATERVERILAAADRPSTATISVSFGCPFEGAVDPGVVAELAERLVAAGAGEVVLADTIGVATPRPVARLVERCSILGVPVGGHFHDTRQTGVACAWAAVEAGATVLDASVGGLGGCPFAPRATGNVATEDVLYLLEREGVETGVDLDALIGVARWLEELFGRELPGRVYRAGGFPAA